MLDTVSATGILVDDLSYMHGIAFAQRLMRERITFIDAELVDRQRRSSWITWILLAATPGTV